MMSCRMRADDWRQRGQLSIRDLRFDRCELLFKLGQGALQLGDLRSEAGAPLQLGLSGK